MDVDTYIVAVSGGVDSVALLDMLATHNLQSSIFDLQSSFIVAHFDHGIREESGEDAEFVKDLAQKYNLPFEMGRAHLGENASEEEAREARYTFLKIIAQKHKATSVVTAHHQDDLIETIIINLIRGTAWRGLVSLEEESENYGLNIVRPLLTLNKKHLEQYALKKELAWVEDRTNTDVDYLRNYVRLKLVPTMLEKDPQSTQKLLQIQNRTAELKSDITNALQQLTSKFQIPASNYQIPRYELIMWPDSVSQEIIYNILTTLDPNWHPSHKQIIRALHFVKTARSAKQLQVSKQLKIVAQNHSVQFKKY